MTAGGMVSGGGDFCSISSRTVPAPGPAASASPCAGPDPPGPWASGSSAGDAGSSRTRTAGSRRRTNPTVEEEPVRTIQDHASRVSVHTELMQLFTDWHSWQQTEPELRRLLPAADADAVARAVEFAVRFHGDQTRPTGAPYAEHLLEALEVLVRGAGVTDPGILQAAVLHDVVEDTPCTIDDVRRAFGGRVAELVAWVTKPDPDGRRRPQGRQGGVPRPSAGRARRRGPGEARGPGVERPDAAQPRPAQAAPVLRGDRRVHHAAGRSAGMVGRLVRKLAACSSGSGVAGRSAAWLPTRTANSQIASVAG